MIMFLYLDQTEWLCKASRIMDVMFKQFRFYSQTCIRRNYQENYTFSIVEGKTYDGPSRSTNISPINIILKSAKHKDDF